MTKTVLITGCSRGIGLVTARYFAGKGWNVVATARHPDSLEGLGRALNVLVVPLDVTDEASIAKAVAAAIERFGGIDVLVNNAGYGLFGPLEGATAKEFEDLFQTNVFGAVAMIRHVLPSMRRRGTGTIINISSTSGRFGSAFFSAYNASKYALEGLSESIRFELKDHGVRVKIVEPGHFKSDFVTRSLQTCRHSAYEPQLGNSMTWVERSVKSAGDPLRVAESVFEAATDASSRLRYRVGGTMLLALRAILPDALWCAMLAGGMKRRPRGRAVTA